MADILMQEVPNQPVPGDVPQTPDPTRHPPPITDPTQDLPPVQDPDVVDPRPADTPPPLIT